ncbi:MAG: peptidylprolyl isomerase [Prevotella sp.]|nr:peptidylprolyl isomerase [Prevotella sp.]
MKRKLMVAALIACCTMVWAQNDPTIMKINGQPISRSEFEYSYNKNNSEGVIDKKSVEEYVDLFVNYKLKVAAAFEAGLDTMQTFKKEFLSYRDQQIRPTFITNADVEAEAMKIYKETQERIDGNGGMVKTAHILLAAKQQAPKEDVEKARMRADSIYNVILNGGDFAELARKYSDDKRSGMNGGELGWIQKGVTVKEFENAIFNMKVGEISQPVESPFGFHIIRVEDKGNFFPYDSVHADILKFIEQRGIRERIIDEKLKSLAAETEGATVESLLDERTKELEANDLELKYLNKEYFEGPLLFEISSRTVWDKAAKDEKGLAEYFKKHKKNYKWEEPRFKGMVYHVRDAADVKAVKNCVKGLAFDKWAERLRTTFNSDSIHRIRVEKGIFKKGDNALVDKLVFKTDANPKKLDEFPIDSYYGKVLKAPEDYTDVRPLVTADYQEELEKAWVEELRKKYEVIVYPDVLSTVNNH